MILNLYRDSLFRFRETCKTACRTGFTLLFAWMQMHIAFLNVNTKGKKCNTPQNKTNNRYRATATLRQLQIKQYTASIDRGKIEFREYVSAIKKSFEGLR